MKYFYFLCLFCLFPFSTMASFVEIDGIYYDMNVSQKTASVTHGNKKYMGNIVIPETVPYNLTTFKVTTIGNEAFDNCIDLKSVVIGNNIKSIGQFAFRGCTSLTELTIGESVDYIGTYCFFNCTGLNTVYFHCGEIDTWLKGNPNVKNIVIGNEVTKINGEAFSDCAELVSVYIGSGLKNIGSKVFKGCPKLMHIDVSQANQLYDSRAKCNAIIKTSSNSLVAGCRNTTIPNTIAIIESNSFNCCQNLTTISIPNSVTKIESYAFAGCIDLMSVNLGNSITDIYSNVFYGCSKLIDVTIPNSVKYIGGGCFQNCTSLKNIKLPN